MYNTVSAINTQLFSHRLSLLWYNVRIVSHIVYLIFRIFSIPLLTIYFAKSGYTILSFLSFLLIYYNFHMLAKEMNDIDNEYNELKTKRNELCGIIYNKTRLKELINKSESKELDYSEYNELCCILDNIGVGEKEAEEIIKTLCSDEFANYDISIKKNQVFDEVVNADISTEVEENQTDSCKETLSMISFVDFEDIKDDLTTFWVSGKEMFWYQKAWSILEEYGLTSYDNDLECCEVYLRAISLCMIYSDFCKLAFGEYDYYDCYEEKYEDVLDDITLGMLYSKLEDVEYNTDKHIIVCELADSKRREVMSALYKRLDEFEIFMGMYFTSFEPYDVSLDTYEEYWDVLLNKSMLLKDDIVSEDGITFESQQAYDWILEGAYRVQKIDC